MWVLLVLYSCAPMCIRERRRTLTTWMLSLTSCWLFRNDTRNKYCLHSLYSLVVSTSSHIGHWNAYYNLVCTYMHPYSQAFTPTAFDLITIRPHIFQVNSEMLRENLERIVGKDDSAFSGLDLATLIRNKYGRSYDVQLIKKVCICWRSQWNAEIGMT